MAPRSALLLLLLNTAKFVKSGSSTYIALMAAELLPPPLLAT